MWRPILSSPMRNECELFQLNSDDDMCLTFVSVVPCPVVDPCDFASCDENLWEEGFVEFDMNVSVRNQFQPWKSTIQSIPARGRRHGSGLGSKRRMA